MQSVIAGLVRQALVAASIGAVLAATIVGSAGQSHRAGLAKAEAVPPIQVKSIMVAAAPTPLVVAATAKTVVDAPAKSLAQPQPAHRACPGSSCPRLAAAAPSRPRTASKPLVEPVEVALVAPAAKADSSPGLTDRFLMPVDLLRDHFARLISRL